MQQHELDALQTKFREYALQQVTLDGITKPLHEWATERKLTIERIYFRRKRNSWAESLAIGSLHGKALRKDTGTIKGGTRYGT